MSSTEISDNNSNDKRGLTDLEWCEELYQWLQGEPIEGQIPNGFKPKLTPNSAFRVIWFLQEHLRVIPDNIERCQNCNDLYDTYSEGTHIENSYKNMNFFCGCCMDIIPEKHFND
jgi:hypothetical protein